MSSSYFEQYFYIYSQSICTGGEGGEALTFIKRQRVSILGSLGVHICEFFLFWTIFLYLFTVHMHRRGGRESFSLYKTTKGEHIRPLRHPYLWVLLILNNIFRFTHSAYAQEQGEGGKALTFIKQQKGELGILGALGVHIWVLFILNNIFRFIHSAYAQEGREGKL